MRLAEDGGDSVSLFGSLRVWRWNWDARARPGLEGGLPWGCWTVGPGNEVAAVRSLSSPESSLLEIPSPDLSSPGIAEFLMEQLLMEQIEGQPEPPRSLTVTTLQRNVDRERNVGQPVDLPIWRP